VTFEGSTAPPAAVRAAFALFLADAALSLLNAILQLVYHLGGPVVLVGAVIEAVLFISLGSRMRQGKQWARGALLGLAGLFVALGVLVFLTLHSAFGSQTNGLVGVALVCVGLKAVLIATATAMMYRPDNTAYFNQPQWRPDVQ
jgi:cobalamin biosynthesis protein CobD/CbiB